MKPKIIGLCGDSGVRKTSSLEAFLPFKTWDVYDIEGGANLDVIQSFLDHEDIVGQTTPDLDSYSRAMKVSLGNEAVTGIWSDSISALSDELFYGAQNPYFIDGKRKTSRQKQDTYGELGYIVGERILYKRILAARKSGTTLVDVYHAAERPINPEQPEGPSMWTLYLPSAMARRNMKKMYDLILTYVQEANGLIIYTTTSPRTPDAKNRCPDSLREDHPKSFPYAKLEWYLKTFVFQGEK